ncbi:MAG: DUF2867 domain-containing protein [Helicobacteraceae bacterium]|nr:DUF2867 domain-containing protein [Helicobacteraceae bacterium]
MENKKVAIFGATGYVGLILVNRLIEQEIHIKLFLRNKQRVKHLRAYPNIKMSDIELTLNNRRLIAEKLHGIETIYYLIHSMDAVHSDDFEKTDLILAQVVSQAAYVANVKEIIYLGGLGVQTPTHPLSAHLRNRHEVGDKLRESGMSITEIRAGVIIGAGSASFEIIRSLGKRLPFIPKLPYQQGRCNPVDIDDMIAYLLNAYHKESYRGKIIEVGTKRSYSYDEMIAIFAKVVTKRELKIINIYFLGYLLNKKILSYLVSYFSAIPYALSKPLIEGIDSIATKGEYDVELIDNSITPLELEDSVAKASEHEENKQVESFWAIPSSLQVLANKNEEFLHVNNKEKEFSILDNYKQRGILYEIRERIVAEEDVEAIFNEIQKIGGEHGYWSPSWMWKIRAKFDKILGGPGMSVGRRTHQANMRIGERLDFWIISAYQNEKESKVLTLKGRLKSPGDSWLQFVIIKVEDKWKFTLRAYFNPKGYLGYAYWYSLFFVHKYIFDTMIDNIMIEAKK